MHVVTRELAAEPSPEPSDPGLGWPCWLLQGTPEERTAGGRGHQRGEGEQL